MYAIVEEGGKQYRVEKDSTLFIERRDLPENAKSIAFERVLMIGNGTESKIGTPVVEGAKVTAKIVGDVKGPKIDIFKMKRRKGYRLRKGHRQKYLKVTVDQISG